MASYLYESVKPKSQYVDKKLNLTPEEYARKLAHTKTIYVGNLSVETSEENLY